LKQEADFLIDCRSDFWIEDVKAMVHSCQVENQQFQQVEGVVEEGFLFQHLNSALELEYWRQMIRMVY
jgi:hypothetical protein